MRRHTINRHRALLRLAAVAIAAVTLTAALAPRASADEGYDLMRQITTQWVKPLIMIVFDRSGSMAFTPTGTYWDNGHGFCWAFHYDDDVADSLTLYWGNISYSDYTAGSYHGFGQGFWMRVKYTPGSSGSTYNGFLKKNKPTVLHVKTDTLQVGDIIKIMNFITPSDNGTYKILARIGGNPSNFRYKVAKQLPNGSFEASAHSFTVVHNKDTLKVKTGTLPQSVWYFIPPSRMAIAKNIWGNSINIYFPLNTVEPTGQDSEQKDYYVFVGEGPVNGAWYEWTGNQAGKWHNWSSSDGHEPVGDPDFTNCILPTDMVRRFSRVANLGLVAYSGSCDSDSDPEVWIIPRDNAQNPVIAALEEEFGFVVNGGLVANGGTPTKGALERAENAFSTIHAEDDVNSNLYDPKNECGRTYGVILQTDGESNACNPEGSSWNLCPDSWDNYPAGASNALWNLEVDGDSLNVRTWVIGVSEGVGPCELNYTAYKGRTDASSPNGDGGFDVDADPYLTADNTNVYDSTWSHGPYAYFAGSVDELRRALLEILASLGAGDYTTSAPAVAGSASGTTNVAIMPSTDYPTWKGHLRAFANERDQNGQRHWVEKWDAGEVLSSTGNNNGYQRKIYTWDPADDYKLVEVASSNINTLNAICGSACTDAGGAIDAGTVSFIRGSGRDWKLGALINSTPAVVGPPNHWRQGVAERHSAFEDEYADRHRMVWVGSSDGMVHAFDTVDGAEIIALIPPDMLDQQVALYQTWLSNPSKYPMGQYKHPANHKYGVANSIRFADVWDGSINSYRTILVIPEGPGGTGLHAVDVTHVYPGRTIAGKDWDPDPNFDDSKPVTPLWSLTGNGEAGTRLVAGLGKTWSLPAIALRPNNGNGEPQSQVVLGRGFVPNEGNQEDAKELVLDPISGNILRAPTLGRNSSGTALVGQQAFADAVLWQTDAGYYHEDNLADEGVQLDLNGQVWSLTGSDLHNTEVLINVTAGQPLYYSPGVAAYPTIAPTMDLFAFSSGTFYETSEAITGSSSGFVPKLYAGLRDLDTGNVEFAGVPITDLPLPEGQSGTLGDRAQVIAPPLLLVPAMGSNSNPFALYLVYDPDGGVCVGKSYIVWLEFDPDDLGDILQHPGDWAKSFEAGEGAAGGFALAGDKVVVSQSAVGQGAEATLVEVPGLTIPPGNPGLNISWWYELQ